MANTKISELAEASMLDGTESFPVVQGGVTKKTTPASLITDRGVVTATRDASGNVVGLSAVGSTIALPLRGTTMLVDGDSYADVLGTQDFSDDTSRGAVGISGWLQWLMLGRLRPVANLGVGGQTTTQIIARLQASVDVCAKLVLLVSPGINDVKGAIPVATTIANLTAIFDAHIANGSTIVTITCPPSNLIDTTAEKQALFTLNRWLLDESTRRPGLIVVDVNPAVSAPATVAWRTGYSTDATHPNVVGSHAIADLIAAALDKVIPSTGSVITTNNADPYELVTNPRMVGDTAGVADSTTSTGGTGAASKVARTDIEGDWQRWDGTAAGLHYFFKSVTTGYSAGQRLVGRVELRAPDAADWGPPTQSAVYIEQRNSSNAVVGTSISVELTVSSDAAFHDRIIVELNPVTVHADAVGGSIRLGYKFNGVGKIDIGAMSLLVVGT